jgi:hypothetical protein
LEKGRSPAQQAQLLDVQEKLASAAQGKKKDAR